MTDLMPAPTAPIADPASADGTPQGAPPPPAPAIPAASTPPAPDIAAIQRWNTQLAQQNAEMRSALGLGRDATEAQVKAALTKLKQPRQDDPEITDPEAIRHRELYVERLWEAEERNYGDVAVQARSLWEVVRTSNDPREVTLAVYAAAQAIAQGLVAGQQTQQTPPQEAPPRPSVNGAGSEPPLEPSSRSTAGLARTGKLQEAFRRMREGT